MSDVTVTEFAEVLRVPVEKLLVQLDEAGIPTAIHYPVTLDQQPALAEHCRIPGNLAVAHEVAREVISLPMHPYLGSEDLERVTGAVCAALN